MQLLVVNLNFNLIFNIKRFMFLLMNIIYKKIVQKDKPISVYYLSLINIIFIHESHYDNMKKAGCSIFRFKVDLRLRIFLLSSYL